MSVFAVVPVKSLLKSKTRLSIALSPQERASFTLCMLEDVLKALKSSVTYRIVVTSSDLSVQTFAHKSRVAYVPESQPGLNQAIEQAIKWCIQKGAEWVLILPADVPLITSEDINQIVKLGLEGASIVVSPSLNGGTNALLQKQPSLIPACFGPHSFMKHVSKASAKGVSMKLYCSKGVIFDVDSIDDLKSLFRINSRTVSHRFLEQIGLGVRISIV